MAKFDENFEGWYKYAERARDRPPRPLLVDALAHVKNRNRALDFGSGALTDSRFLVDEGFAHTIALDGEPIAEAVAKTLPADRFTYSISSFENYAFPASAFDLINAQYALPFIRQTAFGRVFADLAASLQHNGILTGQLFGDRDDWVGTDEMTFHNVDEARSLLRGFDNIMFCEEERDGQTLNGAPKHWHLFNFIVRKR